ncbi:hypothetical protein EEB14_34835 [Rhodococcus sp. WS4]|nr:hypothetical protein EEB14_34835 [Rhodococcus sp. WS4]
MFTDIGQRRRRSPPSPECGGGCARGRRRRTCAPVSRSVPGWVAVSVQAKLLEDTNIELCRGYAMKEKLQHVYSGSKKRASVRLQAWVQMAQDSGIPELVGLAKSIVRYRREILNAIEYDLSNARVEANNTHLQSLTKRSYGFHSPESLIAMATLTRGRACPALPQR